LCHCLIKGEKNKTKQNKNPKFKCHTVSVSPSAYSPTSVVVSSKEQKKKKRVWRLLCECLSEAAAHLPPTVSHLLLQALFIADLRSELYTYLAPQALFIESSLGHMPLLFVPVYSPTHLLQLQSFFI
jgi:hypothetical protein